MVQTNIAFATRISDMQEVDNDSINKLIDIIAEQVEADITPSDYVKATLIPPTVLMLQMIEMTIQSVTNIGASFQGMGLQFDPYYFLKNYIPHFDWDSFKASTDKKETIDTIKKELKGGGDTGGGFGGGY